MSRELNEAIQALQSAQRALEKAIGAFDNAERIRCIDASILMSKNARIKIINWREKKA